MEKILSTLLLMFLLISTVYSQKSDTLEISRIQGSIQFDGSPFEASWDNIKPLPLVMFTPKYEGELTEKTEIRVAYDDDYFYVSGRFYDSEPNEIQGNSLIRDGNTAGDFLNVCIDSFNDSETYWYFGTMPSGNRIDAEIGTDAETPEVFNGDWNTFWDVKTTVTDSGWFAELRVPFSSLRFKKIGDDVIFGFSANRLIGRKFERQVFPNIPPNWPTAVWKASQAQKIRITGIEEKKPLYVSPYVLGGKTRENNISPLDNNVNHNDSWHKEAGIDIKYGLSSNFTLDITANTDFAQVEADNFQANLSRFSLFFPEKRQFFQERAGIYSFQTSGLNRLFNSRVIGLTADGRAQRVYGGLRLIGRSKGRDIGILSMQTDAPDSIGSTNFSVVRFRQRVFNINSYVGMIGLSKIDQNGDYNYTYGLDAFVRVKNQNFLSLKGGQSFTNDTVDDGYFLYGKWEKRAFQGLGYSLEYDKTNNDFKPQMGFILRRNVVLSQTVSYGFFPNKATIVRSITPSFSNIVYLRNSDESVETVNSKLQTSFTLLNGASFGVGVQRVYDEVEFAFPISDEVVIVSGDYDYRGILLNYSTNENASLRFQSSIEVGEYYNGDNYLISFSPSWNVSKHLELRATYAYNRIDFPTSSVRADVGSLRALIAMDLHWSISSLVQYNKLNEKLGANIRLRYNHSEGRDLYIVFNHFDNLETQTFIGDRQPGVENWSLFIKYTHALNLTK